MDRLGHKTRTQVPSRTNWRITSRTTSHREPSSPGIAHLSDLEMDDENETLTVKVNDAFAEQSFTPQVVEDIYAKIKEVLPSPYDDYFLRVETHNYEIQEPFPTV